MRWIHFSPWNPREDLRLFLVAYGCFFGIIMMVWA